MYSLEAISFFRATVGVVCLTFPETLGTQRSISRNDALVFRMLGVREVFMADHLRTAIKQKAEGGDTRDLRKLIKAIAHTGAVDVGMYLFFLTHAARTCTVLGIDFLRVGEGVTMMAIAGAASWVVGKAAIKFGGLQDSAQDSHIGRS